MKCDPQAARTVFSSGVPLLMAGLESTTMMKFEAARQKAGVRLWRAENRCPRRADESVGRRDTHSFDTVAVAHALRERYAEMEPVCVEVEDSGLTRRVEGTPNATLLVRPQKEAFLDWFVAAMAPRPR